MCELECVGGKVWRMGGRGRTEAEQKGKRAKGCERKSWKNPIKSQRDKKIFMLEK